MRYTKFTIKNYKGIQELSLDLDKQPTSRIITLVGLNESGKTSILEAINLLQHDLPEEERHRLIPKKNKLNFTGLVSIVAELSASEADNNWIQKKANELGIYSIKPINKLSITKTYRFEDSEFVQRKFFWEISTVIKRKKNDNYTELKPEDDIWHQLVTSIREFLIPRILYFSDFLFDFPTKIYLDEVTSTEEGQSQFRDIIQDILTSIDKNLTVEEHIIKRLQNNSESIRESLDHTLSKMSSQISRVVLGAWKNIMNIQGKEIFVEAKTELIRFVSKDLNGQLVEKKEPAYYLEFRLKEGPEKYYISERSLGFKWFFTFLLFTEFRKNRKTDLGETLFLLDEPASNLHSTAQKKLLDKFSDLTEKSKLIYTTHSHHLINPKWLNGTYIVKNEAINYNQEFDFDSSNTNIKAIIYKQFVSKNPNQQDYFQPILDTLNHQPGLLEKIPNLILLEGKSDYYIFRYINEILMSNKHKQMHFYPGTGADGNHQVIKLYMAWGRKYQILLDGDGGGNQAQKRYIKAFGEEVKSQIITFLDVDSSWKFPIEKLFLDDELLQITRHFDMSCKSYDKSKFSTAIQNLYVTKTKISISTETLKRFEKIYNKLKS